MHVVKHKKCLVIVHFFSALHSGNYDSDQRVGPADHQGVQEVLQTAGAQGGVCLWRHRYQ